MIKIYTDGSCNKGNGGWAFILIDEDNDEWHMSDGEKDTTNNRMELKAIIEALREVKENETCEIYSDSMLCINCAEGKWKRNKNLDLWKEYDVISKNKKIKFIWVKGHSGDKYNEMVDKIAFNEMKNLN